MTPMSYGKLKGLRNHRTGEDSTLELKIEPLKTGYAKKNPEKTEDSTLELKIQELAEKVEQDIPIESEVKELLEEAEKDQEKMKKLIKAVKDTKNHKLYHTIFPMGRWPMVKTPKEWIDSTFDLKIKKLAEKAEQDIPVKELVQKVKELVEEAEKDPVKMKMLKYFVKNGLRGIDSDFDAKIQEWAEKDEKGIPAESEAKELMWEVMKNPKVVDAQKKAIKKRFIVPALIGWKITFPANPEKMKKLKGLRHYYATFFDRTGTPVESEAIELVEEAEKDPEKIKKLKGLGNLKTGEDSTLDGNQKTP